MKINIVILLLCLVTITASAQITISNTNILAGVQCTPAAPPVSAWTFDAETQTITAYDGSLGTDIIIPETIGGIAVLNIGANAFDGDNISSVVLPEGLLTIGTYAFSGGAMTNVIVPTTVTTIGSRAFNGQPLTSITIPSNMTIGSDVFGTNYPGAVNSQYSLYENKIGGTFEFPRPGQGWLWYRTALDPEYLANFTIVNDTVTNYNVASGGTVVVLPLSKDEITTTKIGESAFSAKGITSLIFPAQSNGQYTNIANYAFMNHAINTLNLPNSMASVGMNAFAITDGTSPGTTYLSLLGSSASFGSGVFSSNQNITTVNMVGNFTVVPQGMFASCVALSQVQMHTGTWANPSLDGNNYGVITSVGNGAFAWTNVSTITIPNSCTSIEAAAFYTLPGISRVVIPAGVSIADATSFNNSLGTQASFKAYYEAGGSLAGTYEYIADAWSKTH